LDSTSEQPEVILSDFFLTFVTRPGCHLCDEAEPVVRRAVERRGMRLRVVDLESDDELVRRFSWRIPVVLGPDGEVIAEGRIEERAFRRVLRRARREA
jgi:hypothetical protein